MSRWAAEMFFETEALLTPQKLERGFFERRSNEKRLAVQSLANPPVPTCRFDWSGPPA
jgi:hypothetical protein